MGIKETLVPIIEKAIIEVTASPSDAFEVADGLTLGKLRAKQSAKAGLLAAPTLAGPLALAALPLEMAGLIRLMSTSALGVGWALGRSPAEGDFMLVLAVWSGEVAPDKAAAAKAAAGLVPAAGALSTAAGSLGYHVSANTVGTKLVNASIGSLTGIGHAYMPYAAKQLAASLVGKVGIAIPVLGAVLSAGINVYVVNSVMNAAEKFYRAA